LTGTGLTGSGPYSLASTDEASLQASLRALVFNPTDGRIPLGTTETTTFTLVVSDGTLSDTDDRTTAIVSQPLRVTDIAIAGTPTNTSTAVDFIVTFNATVTGVDLTDFTLDNSAGVTASLAGISGSGATYTITVNNIAGDGSLSIDLNDSGTGIVAGAAVLSSGFTIGVIHAVGDAFDVSQAIYAGNEDRFSVNLQEQLPQSLTFNSDGTKMFVLGRDGGDINEYTLGVAYDVSTAMFAGDVERFSVAAQDINPVSLAFNNDGTKMFVMGAEDDDINEYTLGVAYDVSTAIYTGEVENFSVGAQQTQPTSLVFSNDGLKMFVMGRDAGFFIHEYTLGITFDVSTAVYAGDSERFSVQFQDAAPFSLAFNSDGTKMFMLGGAGDDIYEYRLSVAFDVSAAVYTRNENFSVTAQDTQPTSLAFNSDGTKFFVIGQQRDNINEYSLAQPVIRNARNRNVNDNATVNVFGNIFVADPNADDISATITLDDNAKGVLTGAGLTGSGPYTLASTGAASLQASLRALLFHPTGGRVPVGTTETTTFTLVISDGILSDTDERTTVVSTAVAPAVTITSNATSPTNGFDVIITFSQGITGFVLGDISVGNGTVENFVVTSASVYAATIVPTADGLVTVDVAGGVAENGNGVGNTAATQFSITADVTNPTVAITSPIADATNEAFTVTFTFSEEVTDFEVGDIAVGNGTAGSFIQASASVYTAEITLDLDGLVTVDVAADVAEDAATNGNTAATQFSILYDNTDPTVIIASAETTPTNSNPIPVTLTFSEEVTEFAVGDLTVGNGTAANFATADNIVFTADITPTADGNVTTDIAATIAQDLAGNDNEAATQFSILYDGTDPTVVITSTATSPTNSNPIPITLTFSEEVTGFALGDLTVGNGTAGNFSTADNIVFTADITPTADGNVTVDIATNVTQDEATNGNTAAIQFSIAADVTDPIVTITSLAANSTNETFTATFTFSEGVTGFEVGDITVSNGTAGSFTQTSALVYTAEIAPTADGLVTIDIAANVAEDAATNGNSAAIPFSINYDTTNPMVIITSTETTSTNSNPIPIIITFSEEVTGFVVGDLTVGNGTAANFATADNIVFTADITPIADGNVTVDINTAIAQDLVGNNNNAATQFSIIYDGSVTSVICQDITVQLDADGTATIEADQIDNESSDNFGIATTAIDLDTFDCDDIGDNNVTLTITDTNGNIASCVAVVTVEDTIAPIVITQDITVALDVNGQASITPADIDNGSTDNCDIASMTLDTTTFDTPTTTSTTVILTVTDVNGNSSTNTAVVTFGKVSQIIVFDPLADKKVGEDPVLLQATGGDSGLPIVFSIATEPVSGVASLLDNTIMIEGPGIVVVTASQAGNDTFSAATDVSQRFEILPNELFLPTLFTPNGDLTNDRFIVRGGGNVATIQLRIFDRDNNLVFSSDSLTELFQAGWDGGEQPQGAYIWVIKGSFTDGSPLLVSGKDTGIIRLAR